MLYNLTCLYYNANGTLLLWKTALLLVSWILFSFAISRNDFLQLSLLSVAMFTTPSLWLISTRMQMCFTRTILKRLPPSHILFNKCSPSSDSTTLLEFFCQITNYNLAQHFTWLDIFFLNCPFYFIFIFYVLIFSFLLL